MLKRFIIVLLTGMICMQQLLAQTRIMLLSDTHVMAPELLIKDGEAWQFSLSYDRKLNDYSAAIFDEAVNIAKREKPDFLMISGDLTKDGEIVSHQYVVKRLKELKEAGIRSFVIPGNHDMGTAEAFYFDGDEIYEAETLDRDQFPEYYKEFGYGDALERDPESLSYVCEPVDGLVLIGIDTGCDGEPLNGVISVPSFNWVEDQVEKAKAAGKQVLVMMHHALFPHVKNFDKISSTYVVKLGMLYEGVYNYYSYKTIRNHLIRAGVRVVFSGHVHATDIGKDTDYDHSNPIYDVSTSTTAAYPNPYRMLELNEDFSKLSIRTHYISELPGVDDFAAMAEARIMQGLQTLSTQFSTDKERNRLLAEMFMLHVKGNENADGKGDEYMRELEKKMPEIRADKQAQSFMEGYGVTFDELLEMAHSMLEDKTNYGDEELESVMDDLNLTISLNESGWTAIRTIKERQPADENYYTLQGVRVEKPLKKGIYIHKGRLTVSK